MKMMILSSGIDELRLAILHDGVLTDFAIEGADDGQLLGCVFKGIVKNVVTALDAAFVDIGTGVNGYLPLLNRSVRDVKGNPITVGSQVLVQVSKDARGTKGPMLTSKISLTGRYAVLLGAAQYIGVSKKVTDDDVRTRLREVATPFMQASGCGYVLRTAAAAVDAADLKRDLALLSRAWGYIKNRLSVAKAPACLYREADLVLRAVRDYLASDVSVVMTDSTPVYERLCELVDTDHAQTEIVYESDNLFNRYQLSEVVSTLFDRRVDLDGGGYLVIDYTEAMTVIDVNSGGFRGGHDRMDFARRLNTAAAMEVARQIRLRNIGGMILVDFIDMKDAHLQAALLKQMRELVLADRVRTVVVDMTPLGLMEITRRKTGEMVSRMRSEDCSMCAGTGRVRTVVSMAESVLDSLDMMHREGKLRHAVVVHVDADVRAYLQAHYSAEMLRRRYARSIRFEAHDKARDVVMILADMED